MSVDTGMLAPAAAEADAVTTTTTSLACGPTESPVGGQADVDAVVGPDGSGDGVVPEQATRRIALASRHTPP
jgi:hypothetical protein